MSNFKRIFWLAVNSSNDLQLKLCRLRFGFLLAAGLNVKACARIAILLTALGMGAASRAEAQTCTTPISGWGGQYSISGNGTGTDAAGFQWTITESASGTVNAPLSAVSCTTGTWTGQGTVSTVSVNDQGVQACPPNSAVAQQTITLTGSSVFLAYSLVTLDLSNNAYSLMPATSSSVTLTTVDCGGKTITEPLAVQVAPFNWVSPVNAAANFLLPSSPQSLTGNMSNFKGIWTFEQIPIGWNFSFTLNPRYSPDDDCQQQRHSRIACQNQSLGEPESEPG